MPTAPTAHSTTQPASDSASRHAPETAVRTGFALPSWLPAALLALGALLRVRQYAMNRSLWQDESSLALNFVERGFRGLLEPLDYGQMAPLGFLWLEEAVTRVLGSREPALRLVPLAFGLASLPLFDAVARRCLGARGRVIALTLFATAGPLVWYASEAKQYAGDVAFGLALTALALETARRGVPARHAAGLGALGALAAWFSHAAILVMGGIGIALAVDALRRRDASELTRLALTGVPWAASVAAVWWIFVGRGTGNENLAQFWHFAFLPFPPRGLAEALWLPEQLLSMTDLAAGLRPPTLGIAAFAVGVIGLSARSGRTAAVLGVPGLVALGASALEIYPFFQRFMLFFAPALLIFAAEGADRAGSWLARRNTALGIALPLLLVAGPVGLAAKHLIAPPTRDHVRPVLEQLAERAQPSDTLWIYFGAARQFRYYAPRWNLDERTALRGLGPAADNLHRRWAQWPRLELERLQGRGRVWLVFSNVREPAGRNDERALVELLDLHGRRLDALHAPGAAAYLYDMGTLPGGDAVRDETG